MDEACNYSKLKMKKRKSSSAEAAASHGDSLSDVRISMSNLNIISPPKDPYNIIYFVFILGGAGFLLPYNTFIMAMDYFKEEFPKRPVVFEMSLVYIVTAFITVLGNSFLVEACSLTNRITFGYVLSFFILLFVSILEIDLVAFSRSFAYRLDMGAVAIAAIGCTVQQSSFYGYTSMLPARYTQAVMVGESVSGVSTSVVRVLTKYLIPDVRASTECFFGVSIMSIFFYYILYHIVRKTDFIQFYLALHERAKTKIVLEPAEDAGLMDNAELQYGMLKIQNSPPPNACLSFNNPAYEPGGQAPNFKVEDIIIKGRTPSVSGGGRMSDIKRAIQSRIAITRNIYPYMIAICLVYFETLCVYPGVASEIHSCHFGNWMPILMLSLFNGADLLGKILTSTHAWMHLSRKRLVRASVVRLLLVPLMITCAQIHSRPGLYVKDVLAFVMSITLGVTNGVLGSVPMIQAPGQVDDCYRELTGNLMTLLYNFGLISGSLTAYFIESIIPVYGPDYCQNYHMYATAAPTVHLTTPITTTTTTMGITTLAAANATSSPVAAAITLATTMVAATFGYENGSTTEASATNATMSF